MFGLVVGESVPVRVPGFDTQLWSCLQVLANGDLGSQGGWLKWLGETWIEFQASGFIVGICGMNQWMESLCVSFKSFLKS